MMGAIYTSRHCHFNPLSNVLGSWSGTLFQAYTFKFWVESLLETLFYSVLVKTIAYMKLTVFVSNVN